MQFTHSFSPNYPKTKNGAIFYVKKIMFVFDVN